jgi:hypothetical protein
MENKINYDGKEYNSIEDLPPEARKIFDDKDSDGVPDIFDGLMDASKNLSGNTDITTSTFVVDGKTYNNLEEVPAEKREIIRNKLNKLSNSRLKPFGDKVVVNTKEPEGIHADTPGGLENASQELPSNFKFKIIMLVIFFVFMIYFVYSLIKMLTK